MQLPLADDNKKILLTSIVTGGHCMAKGHFNGADLYIKCLLKKLKEENFEVYIVLLNFWHNQIDKSMFDHPAELIFTANVQLSQRNYLDKFFATGLMSAYTMSQEIEIQSYDLFNGLIEKYHIKNIVIDYFYSAVFLQHINKFTINKTIMVLNNEANYYNDVAFQYANEKKSRLTSLFKNYLMRRLEKRIYNSFDRIIAIGSADIPAYLPPSKTRVMTLYIDESAQKWQYKNNNTLFFIGSFDHYPNRLAVNYLLEKIVPRIATIRPDYKFVILGTSDEQIVPEYRYPNVQFFGPGTPETAKSLFLSANLMLVPIENSFGQKMKIAEAVSYGTPFLASAQSMLGFPYLSELPYAPLESPEESVKLIVELMDTPAKCRELSDRILSLSRSFINLQKNICQQCFLL